VPTTAPRRPRRLQWLPLATWGLGLLPVAKMAVDGLTGRLGANPIEAVLNRLGFWTLTFLAVALVPTPARELLSLPAPGRLRRHLGLLAFAYATLHLAFYVAVDRFFDVRTLAADLTRRPFILVGFAAWLLLVPLAITSTDAWIRRLGSSRWRWLHRLVYPAAVLALVHFLWRVKADRRRPLAFAAVVGILLLARVPGWVRAARRRAAGTPRPARPERAE
jgi:methionine sulfoxide reductase heme-binding subunit